MCGNGAGGSPDSPHLQSEAVPFDQKRAGEKYCVKGTQVGAGLPGCLSDMDSEAHTARGQLQRLTQPLRRHFPIPLKAPFQGKAAHVRNMCVPTSA